MTAPLGVMLKWIDAGLGELWRLRGPTPGLGVLYGFRRRAGQPARLRALGVLGENESPWLLIDGLMDGSAARLGRADELLTRTVRDKWIAIREKKPERRALL